ncbi:lipoprotein [Kozakia baliensis]|nr:lipoprotein [Kozakia baliensis]
MRKIFLAVMAAFALTACNGIQHASCPNAPADGPQDNSGVKSVIQTCN